MITICFVHFKSLGLANLAAALYSVRQQDLSHVRELVVVDNDSVDAESDIRAAVHGLAFPIPVRLLSFKHGDAMRTHAWATNVAVRMASSLWVLYTRSDYLLDFYLVGTFAELAHRGPRFITSWFFHTTADIATCEGTSWRQSGPRALRRFPGSEEHYSSIDAGVWMLPCAEFARVGGFDERLSAWGHAQTHFQHKLHEAGVKFEVVPDVLFYHPQHAAPRDIVAAHRQLTDIGVDVKELWARYEGVQPYK